MPHGSSENAQIQ